MFELKPFGRAKEIKNRWNNFKKGIFAFEFSNPKPDVCWQILKIAALFWSAYESNKAIEDDRKMELLRTGLLLGYKSK